MTKSNLSALVDAYGALMAQRANIEGEKKRMEKALADVPAGAYEGEKFRLSISDTVLEKPDDGLQGTRSTPSWTPSAPPKSHQYVVAHTVKKPSRRHARQGPQRGRGVTAHAKS